MLVLTFHGLEYFFPAPSCLQIFFWEISWQSYGNSFADNCFLCSCCFSDSLFIINLWHFNYNVSWCGPLWVQLLWDSELLGLPRSLFPSLYCGSFLSLCFQISFQFIALLLAPLWFGCWHFWRCPRVFLFFPYFLEFLFFHSVLVNSLFLFSVPNHWFEPWIPSLHCLFPVDLSLFHLVQPSFIPLCLCHTQWVIWASWSTVFWTLHLMGWLSLFHLVLFLGFCSVLSFEPYFFVSLIC